MDCLIVSHTHWDREWYRTFQAFRARLVDADDGEVRREGDRIRLTVEPHRLRSVLLD